MPTCQICETEAPKLIRCHIYPHSWFKEAAGDDRKMIAMAKDRAWISHNGMFDDNIVCDACERLMHKADDYAIGFRRKALALELPFTLKHEAACFPTFKANGTLLHLFAIQTLGRAILARTYFKPSPYESAILAELRDALLGGIPTIGSGRHVTYTITRSELGGMIGAPITRLEQPNPHPHYELKMSKIDIMIAADGRGLPYPIDCLAINNPNEVTIWRRRRPMDIELDLFRNYHDPQADRVDRISKAITRPKRPT